MSAIVGTISSSQNAGIVLYSNLKKELTEQKTDKIETLNSELKENSDICKDLIKEVSKKTDNSEEISAVKKSEISISEEADHKDYECSSNQSQQLTGNTDISVVEEKKSPEVQILSLTVVSPGRADVVLTIPFPSTTSKATLFTLKEGSKYRIKFLFTVTQNVVKNLTYTYMVWKSGIRVHQTKKLIGTFNPRQEQYTFELEEGTTPTGFFARGPFLVRSKFVDDDGNCYLDTTYYFDIRKDWGAREKC